MAAAVLLRSVARKMSRAGAPTHHHRSLVERGLHGGARSGPANSNQVLVKTGASDVLVSAGMAAASGLRSGAGRLTTKMAHAPPQYHRLIHGRGIHSPASPPEPTDYPRTKKVLDALKKVREASVAVGLVTTIGATIYLQFVVRPELRKMAGDGKEQN